MCVRASCLRCYLKGPLYLGDVIHSLSQAFHFHPLAIHLSSCLCIHLPVTDFIHSWQVVAAAAVAAAGEMCPSVFCIHHVAAAALPSFFLSFLFLLFLLICSFLLFFPSPLSLFILDSRNWQCRGGKGKKKYCPIYHISSSSSSSSFTFSSSSFTFSFPHALLPQF